MIKPDFRRLWSAFPDHATYRTMKDLYTALGGAAEKNIYMQGFGPNGNTCASRMSVALNRAGAPITRALAQAAGARTLGAADGSRIIFGVADMRKYLNSTFGKPLIDNTRPYSDAFLHRRGIIAFSVNWRQATGHIALWNGVHFREPGHDDFSSFIHSSNPGIKTSLGELWEIL
jgi:hypothetical protein